ncbi:SERTA domain-containing protein 1-like [Heptranchias perlo]|uniref:SERTA domain-containing protein 1-like n=1 Tax=Heptranchias perlo TaxID=212740 RepID=UPI003559A288
MAAIRFTLGKGVKRKRGEDGDSCQAAVPDHSPPAFQCGSLLDLSLLKLHQSCVLAERNLCRSVLIANTLRRLREEIRRESGHRLPTGDGANRPAPASKPGAETPDLNNNLPSPSPDCAEAPFCLLSGNDSSLSSAISTILKDLDFVQDLSPSPCQSWAEEEHLLPFKPPAPDPRGEAREPKPPDSIFGSFESVDSNDFLIDGSLDEIFEDIDTSMYDPQQSFPAGAWSMGKPLSTSTGQPGKDWCGSPSAKAHNSRTDFTELENLMDLLIG